MVIVDGDMLSECVRDVVIVIVGDGIFEEVSETWLLLLLLVVKVCFRNVWGHSCYCCCWWW